MSIMKKHSSHWEEMVVVSWETVRPKQKVVRKIDSCFSKEVGEMIAGSGRPNFSPQHLKLKDSQLKGDLKYHSLRPEEIVTMWVGNTELPHNICQTSMLIFVSVGNPLKSQCFWPFGFACLFKDLWKVCQLLKFPSYNAFFKSRRHFELQKWNPSKPTNLLMLPQLLSTADISTEAKLTISLLCENNNNNKSLQITFVLWLNVTWPANISDGMGRGRGNSVFKNH